MAHIRDLHGRRRGQTGARWQARWLDPAGKERARAFRTRDEATGFLTRIESSIRAGEYQVPTNLTVSDWIEQWLGRQEHWRASTLAQQCSRLNAHVVPALGGLPLEAVRTRHLDDLAADLRAAGLSSRTRRAILTVTRSMLRAAVEAGHLVSDPTSQIRVPPGGTDQTYDVLTVEQVRALSEAMPSIEHRMLLDLIAGTGLRLTEARSLTTDRLDLTAVPPTILADRQLLGAATRPGAGLAFGPTKGGAAGRRRLAITTDLAQRLAEHVQEREGSELIFQSAQYPGRPMNPRSLAEVWGTAARRAGIDSAQHRGWHALRHHHASRLIASGVSVVAVQRRLGHSSASITLSVYSHLWPTDESSILAALED